MPNALQLTGITKTFGNTVAVDSLDFDLRTGEVHTVLGENGAGKSTLMNLIYGLYQPDEGEIRLFDQPIHFDSPKDSIMAGIGMVHQHFMLVQNLTVAENIALGLPEKGFLFRREEADEITRQLSKRFSLTIEPDTPIWQLSVGLQQRVEILKALVADARILILDEPTAVLAPKEVGELFGILQRLRDDGRAIVFISHKLKEVMEISDRITVMRQGHKVHTTTPGETSEDELATSMMGHEVQELTLDSAVVGEPVLVVQSLGVRGHHGEMAVENVSLDVHRGEIVGIAGVDGNGQVEFAEAIMGLRDASAGEVQLHGVPVTNRSPARIRGQGVGYIPEDRQAKGLVIDFSIAENLMLNIHRLKAYRHRGLLQLAQAGQDARELIDAYAIRAPSKDTPARLLSGGNQQKVVLAREISRNPDLLIAVNPTRGLDVNATRYVHENLLVQRRRSKAVLLISTELDEVLSLSDRVFIMSDGRLIEATSQRDDPTALGLLMTGGPRET